MTTLRLYLARAWLGAFAASLAAAAALYLGIDVLGRVGEVLPFAPAASKLAAYFLFKLPKILFDVFPAACLLATLASLGALDRNRELAAMRAAGVAPAQIAAPVLVAALLLSVGALAWNEAVVPASSSRSRWLWDVELKQKVYRGVFDASSLWFQEARGFVRIDRYDAAARTIRGLTLFETDPAFGLKRITTVDSILWIDGRWVAGPATVKELAGGDLRVQALPAGQFALTEDPDSLTTRRRKPEETGFLEMRRQVAAVEARGLPVGESLVDLHHKLAWPFSGFFVTLLAAPMTLRMRRRGPGYGREVRAGIALGFAYWILTGTALSAGRTGALPPLLAAWTANAATATLALAAWAAGRLSARR